MRHFYQIILCLFFAVAAAYSAPEQTTPQKHPRYNEFTALLKKQVEAQSADYGDALDFVLTATGEDEGVIDRWMQAAAEGGNAAAERWLINRTLSDVPLDKLLSPEVRSAYQKLDKVAAKGYVPAMLDKATCLELGLGVNKNSEASRKALVEACRGGDFSARVQWLIATKRLENFSDKDKPEVASEIKRGNHYVMLRLANLAVSAKDKMDWLTQAAEKGNGDAYFSLSALSSRTQPKQSAVLLKEAVRLHAMDALFTLGTVLATDEPDNKYTAEAGLERDPAKGLHLLRIAAAMGHAQSCLLLGNAYYNGHLGLSKDDAKAYHYFSVPQAAGVPAVASARGLLLLLGQGVKQDTTKALEILNRADKAGFPRAAMHLAYAYYKGIGVKADARRAADYLSEAAATGIPGAYVYLAYITARGGEGLSADKEQAQHYVRLAAMDMGDRAQKLYDRLMESEEWIPQP